MDDGTSGRGNVDREFAGLMAEAWAAAGAAGTSGEGGPSLADDLREAVLVTLQAGWDVFLFLDGLVSRDWAEFPDALTGLIDDPRGAVLMELFNGTAVFTLCRLHYQRARVNLVAAVGAAALPRFLALAGAVDLPEDERSARLADLKAAITAGLANGLLGRPGAGPEE